MTLKQLNLVNSSYSAFSIRFGYQIVLTVSSKQREGPNIMTKRYVILVNCW